ncbi:MAG: hypothetical protein AAGK78_07395, partial [Planctomycetota bacterium]
MHTKINQRAASVADTKRPRTRNAATRRSSILAAAVAATLGAVALPSQVAADDLTWVPTVDGLYFWDNVGSWTPGQIPDATDNLLLDQSGNFNVIVGAPSLGNNAEFANGSWTFIGGAGARLQSSGFGVIDRATAMNLGEATTVTLDSGVLWDQVGQLRVGDVGFGRFDVINGSDWRGETMFLGDDAGSVGVVNVAGTGSTLFADGLNGSNGFRIGENGTGTLNITGGGRTTINTADTSGSIADYVLGAGATGQGTLNIDGAGSEAFAEDIIIGNNGTGTVKVTNGGFFNAAQSTSPDTFLGRATAATGSIVVNGQGSQWRTRRIDVGESGTGTISIEAGGILRAVEASNGNNGDVLIGENATGVGSVAVFGTDGANASRLDVDDNLFVGFDGQGTLRVGQSLAGAADGSGRVDVDLDIRIGANAGNSADNRMIVDGSNAVANVGNVLWAGLNGDGRLDVLNGGTVTPGRLRVGSGAGTQGTLNIDGAGTMVDVT